MSKLTSEISYALTALTVIALGFLKAYLPAYPHETTVTALVALAGLYFGKRLVQKNRMFNNYERSLYNEQGGLSED